MTHDPTFGPDSVANFIDPLEIGGTVTPKPWFALVPGNRWVYESDGESIEVVVTSDTILIDGITCIVVIDTAIEDDLDRLFCKLLSADRLNHINIFAHSR